jgi:DNA repair photolyase
MRWSNLSLIDEDRARLPGYRDDAVVRHFDAPDAVRTRFYEVRAKSILNKVPEASQVPFRWTINPYRGCSHACVYCLAGDTPVLLGNGRHKPIADLELGEEIYGTAYDGKYRRYVRTTVLDRWTTIKRAFRVVLEDGTELVASGDHRFLTPDGWKHVTGPGGEGLDRPHLSAGEALVKTDALADDERTNDLSSAGFTTARITAIDALGDERTMYDITTGTNDFIADGVVSHNCFARPTHTYLDFNAGEDFEREIVVKVNAPERLRAELARPSWAGEHVALGTNTDPYQWVEGRYKLMEGIWEAMRDAANPCSILTKSPLLLRDLHLMRQINERTEFSAALSIPTLDEKAWRATEPHTPNPKARIEAVAELRRAGIRTGVLIAPLMPGVNDAPEQVAEILERVGEAGASYVTGIALHLRGDVRKLFFDWLQDNRPDLVPRYKALYRRGAYAPPEERRRLSKMVNGPAYEPFEQMRGRTRPRPPSAPESPRTTPQEQLF